MRKFSSIFAIFIILLWALPVLAGDIHLSRQLGCSFLLPDDWILDSSNPDKVLMYNINDPEIKISIVRYNIDANNQMKYDADAREAIKGLYESLDIPPEEFQPIEFESDEKTITFRIEYDTYHGSKADIYIRLLKGIIARRAKGGQFFFLLVAESPESKIKDNLSTFADVMESFNITTPLAGKVYPQEDMSIYLYIVLILALTAFFFARNRRIQKSRNPLGRDSSNFWRCSSCGRVNHINHMSCSRCGRDRTVEDISR